MAEEKAPTAEAIRVKRDVGVATVGSLTAGEVVPVERLGLSTAQHLVEQGYAVWAGKGSSAANAAAEAGD